MSTQCTVFFLFLPLFRWYQARRDASRSITSWCLCSLFIGSTDVKNTVCLLLKFYPPNVSPEFMMETRRDETKCWLSKSEKRYLWWSVNWSHIRCDKCTRRHRSELLHCPVMKDQWDCVLNDFEELGIKEFLVMMDQYNIAIFSCFLHLLSLYSSTLRQTIVEIAQGRSEDTPLISRIQSLHHFLEVDDDDEEEYTVVFTVGKRLANNLLAQYQSTFFHRSVQFLWMSWQEYVFVVFALAFDRLAKASTFVFNAQSSNCISELSCSLSSSSLLLLKSVTNLFKPWEILTHGWELSLITDAILFSTPYLPCK